MSARCARQPEGGNSLLPTGTADRLLPGRDTGCCNLGLSRVLNPASGLNAHAKLIDSYVLALHLVSHENKPSARVRVGRRRSHPKEGDPHQRQEARKKETVNSAG